MIVYASGLVFHPILNIRLKGSHNMTPLPPSLTTSPALLFQPRADEALRLYTLGEREKSLTVLKSLEKDFPRVPQVLGTIAVIYHELQDFKKSLQYSERAISLAKNSVPEFYTNRGNTYRALNFHQRAIQEHKKCLKIKPTSLHAWVNLGCVYIDLMDLDLALECFNKAVELDPSSPEALFNLGNFLLVSSNCEKGWEEYEARFDCPGSEDMGKKYPWPRWDGSDPKGKRFLIEPEQGMGDLIHFSRYLHFLFRDGARKITVICNDAIADLFRKAFPFCDIAVGSRNFINSEIDYRCHMVSLARWYQSEPRWIGPYLFGETVSGGDVIKGICHPRKKIGICWAGNPAHKNDFNRSMPQNLMMDLTQELPHVDWYSLQKDRCDEALLKSYNVTSLPLLNFQATANFIACLDMVITVDTSVAHLAGAMGKKTWLLIPKSPDWRYGLTGTKCLWYPEHRIFRQSSRGDWRSLLSEVATALQGEIQHA